MGRPIDEEKQVKKILSSILFWFHAKTTSLKTYFKLGELTVNDLVGNLQAYEMHHFLPWIGELATDRGKKISLKITKDGDNNTFVNQIMANDDNSSLDEEEIMFLAKHFTIFFRNKNNFSNEFMKDTLSWKGSRYGKKNDSKDESKRQFDRNFINMFKYFECGSLETSSSTVHLSK